jgi:hypothetical protein
MNTPLRGLVVSALALTVIGLAACTPSANEGAEGTPDPVAASTTPDPSTSAGTAPVTPTSTVPRPGNSGGLCEQLKVIADADKEVSSLPRAMRLEQLSRRWPEIAVAYDRAMASASPDLVEDLRDIKRVSEILVEALAGEDAAGAAAAITEMTRTHAAEIQAGGLASIKANRFTEDTCGFSLNNE